MLRRQVWPLFYAQQDTAFRHRPRCLSAARAFLQHHTPFTIHQISCDTVYQYFVELNIYSRAYLGHFGFFTARNILDDIRVIFKISPRTLYRWCRRASITPHQHPSENRRRYLTDDERLHHRVLVVDTEALQVVQMERLERRIAALEKEHQ